MDILQEAAEQLNQALYRADYIAANEGGDFAGHTGSILKGETPKRINGLPGEWGGMYQSLRKNLAEAFQILIASARGDMVDPADRIIYVIHHCPSVEDIRDCAVRPYWHRDPELALDATPQDRARWIVKNHKGYLVNLISRIHILEAMSYPEQASGAIETIKAKAPRTLENLSEIERWLLRALDAKNARGKHGIKLGEIITWLQLNYERYPSDRTARKRLKSESMHEFVKCDESGGHHLYSLKVELPVNFP